MRPRAHRLVVALSLSGLMLALALASCGGTARSSTGPPVAGQARSPLDGLGQILFNGKRGGILTAYDVRDFSHLDPGQAYSATDYEIIYATQRPLFFFAPNNSTTAVPDLASGPATISDGGRTLTVHIRRGVRFSPPVNREVTSADVKYAIDRGANPDVSNPYFRAYFETILGASSASGGPIPGIQTPNRYTIVFHLTGPYASFLLGALSLPLSAPVPEEFAAKLDAEKPTAYGEKYLVATGPYMLKANSSGLFLGIGYTPGKSATLVRNPDWNASTDVAPAYLDGVNIHIGGDPNVIGREVLSGHHVVQNDEPSGQIITLAYEQYYRQLVAVRGAGYHYVSLNNRGGPFANVNVRRALWAALNRQAMVNADGGSLVAQVATHFIYPGSAGYALAGGDRGPPVDYNRSFAGNPALAARYMRLAGYPTGRYTGTYTVKIVGATGDPGDETAAIVAQAIKRLGFKTNVTLVQPLVMDSKYCGSPRAEIDACPDASWIRDWSDPQTLLAPTFAGYNIVSANNSNWGQVSYRDWPHAAGGPYRSGPLTRLDQQMRAAEKTAGEASRAAAWAKVDDSLVKQAVAIPWAFDKAPSIRSADVRGISDLWNAGGWDYEFSSLQ